MADLELLDAPAAAACPTVESLLMRLGGPRHAWSLAMAASEQRRLHLEQTDRITPVREFLRVTEWYRFFLERLVLWNLAAVLPLGVAIRVANTTGFIEAAVPSGTTRIARDEIAASTGLRGWGAIPWVARRLAEPRRSLVYKRHLLSKRRRDAGWTFVEEGDNPARELIAEGRSFLLVDGHFQSPYSPAMALVFNRLLGQERRSGLVAGRPPPWRLSPKTLRARFAHLKGLAVNAALFPDDGGGSVAWMPSSLWEGKSDSWERAPVRTNVQDEVLAHLAQPGSWVTVRPDAVWEKQTAYRRPFAGYSERGFAVGVARMARLSQCPIVLLKAVCGPEARVVRVQWGGVIAPPPKEDTTSDERTMDRIIDFIEAGVGHDPTEYSLPIGCERHWNPALEEWQA